MRRVLVSGDREWTNHKLIDSVIFEYIEKYGTKSLIFIGGGCRGLDVLFEERAKFHNVHFARVDALWDTRHQSAGNQRNTAMLLLEPHELVAFHNDIEHSRGTKDMMKQCKGVIPVRLVSEV